MPDECSQCGNPHDGECRRQTATRMAEHVAERPEDLELASLRLRLADLQEQLETLTTEVHQHWA